MTSVFTEDFESGSNGAVLSTSNTVFDSFYGNDATFTDAHSVTGSLAGDFTANGTQCMASTLTSEPVIYRRFYMWIDAIPTSNSFIAQAVESDSNRAQIRIEPDGSLAVRNAFVKVWTSTAPIPTQEWMRVEWKLDSTNQLQSCRLFLGSNLHGTTPNDKSGDVTFDSGTFDQLNIGNVTANTLGLLVDDIEDDNADWPAPAESSPLAVVATAQSTVPTGSLVTLSALASGGGGSYTFAWTQILGPTVSLSGATTDTATFTAPSSNAGLEFKVEVSDGTNTATDTAFVTVAESIPVMSERFNGGSVGEQFTASNTAFDTIVGTVTRDDSWSITGRSAKIDTTSSATQAAMVSNFAATSTVWTRWYQHIPQVEATFLAGYRHGTVSCADLRINADGTVAIRDHYVAVATSTTVISDGDSVRFAWCADSSTATQTLQIYAGVDIHSTTPTETLTGSYSSSTPDMVRLGSVANQPTSWVSHIDDVAIDLSAEPGPTVTTDLGVDAGSDTTANPGQAVTLTPAISGGTEPYSITWMQVSGQGVYLETAGQSATFIAPQVSDDLTFGVTVTDSTEAQAYDEVTVSVTGVTEWSANGGEWTPRRLHTAIGGQWV